MGCGISIMVTNMTLQNTDTSFLSLVSLSKSMGTKSHEAKGRIDYKRIEKDSKLKSKPGK